MGSKGQAVAVVIPAEIEKLQRRVEFWRQSRRHRGPMPVPLWESAARLAQRHGVYRVARIVRLDYHSLKERLGSLNSQKNIAPDQNPKLPPAFIEMQLPFSATTAECLVELERSQGDRLRIHVKGAPAPDLVALIRSFRSTES
jgi:hypothetical protein